MYTVVQHSGVSSGHGEFAGGLEPRSVTAAEAKKVKRVGGVLFEDYIEADLAADDWMYPEGTAGLLPAARGTFSEVMVDGLAVYVPVRETTVVG